MFKTDCLFHLLRNHHLQSESFVSFVNTRFCWQTSPDPGMAQHHLLALLLQQNRNTLCFLLAQLLWLSRRRGEQANCIPNRDYTAFKQKIRPLTKIFKLEQKSVGYTKPSSCLDSWVSDMVYWCENIASSESSRIYLFVFYEPPC